MTHPVNFMNANTALPAGRQVNSRESKSKNFTGVDYQLKFLISN